MVSVYWRHLRAKRIARKSSTKGVSPYAALLALVTLLIIGFIIAEFILFLLKNPTARDILSSTSSSTSSTSSSSTPTNSGLIWKIVFTGTARDAEAWTTANCSGDCPIAESDSWSWSLVYYFITNSQTTFPTSASLYLNGSSISYSGSITYTDPSNNCTFNSDSLTGSGAHDLTFSIYANGTVTNNGGDGWEPWTSVSGSTPSSPVSSCEFPSNGWFDFPGGLFYTGYDNPIANIEFPLTNGVYTNIGGGTVSGVTCPTGVPTFSCIESPGTSVMDTWQGQVVVGTIACSDLPTSLQQDCS